MYYLILLSLAVQNVLTNEYLYPYPRLHNQQSNGYYKYPISVQNFRYDNIEPPEPNTIKVQYNAGEDEEHTKYLHTPKQIFKKDSYQSFDDRIQKLKLTIVDPKITKKKKILFGEIIKTYNKYKDDERKDYEPNYNIEKFMKIFLDPRTPKKYKKIYEEIISTYYRNRDLHEPTNNNVNIIEDDLNNKFDSEKYDSNPEESELDDYDIDMLSERNPRRFLKWFKAWFSKINNSSTTTPAPATSQLPQTGDTGKQLFKAPITELPFTDDSKETEILKNINEVLHKLNINLEKQNKLAAIIFQNLYSQIAQHNMNTNRKEYIRNKRDLNSEKIDAKESIVTNSTLEMNITEDISKKCNSSEAKDGRRVYDRADGMEINQSSPVKAKLIYYIHDTIDDMENKIKPVERVKEGFSTNNIYKVGYIIANIDTLTVNIKKLKVDMDANKDSWDDSSVLDVFDKVMLSNKVINNLMTTLQFYTKFDETSMQQPDLKKELSEIGLPESPIVV